MKINSISDLALSKIKNNMTVSLGGGSNVFNLAKAIIKSNLSITLCSPSELTRQKINKLGLKVKNIDDINHIDLAFDGCDSIDYHFRALKSMGGIHLFEKEAASQAGEYILLLPYERIKAELNSEVPLCIEVAPVCLKQVLTYIKALQLKCQIRLGDSVAAYARTPLGNCLIDIWSNDWKNISKLNQKIRQQNGVVSSSLFENLATSLITKKDDKIIEIKKGDLL